MIYKLFIMILGRHNLRISCTIKIDLGKPRIPEGLSIHYTALYSHVSAVQHHLTDGQGQNFNFNKIMPAVLRERVVIPPPSPGAATPLLGISQLYKASIFFA